MMKAISLKKSSYIFGPVLSRRLGFSLGIDTVSFKICSFDCIYCQLGKTLKKTIRRNKFIDLKRFEKELKAKLRLKEEIDFITFSGSGEPLLNSQLSEILKIVKTNSEKPVCLLTNGSLFYIKKVRKEIKSFDLILPSLDAPDELTFLKINKPHDNLSFKKVVEGLIALRKEFKGKIWLEIMLIKGINDSVSSAKKFNKIIKKINPDKVQINLPSRIPSEGWVEIPSKERLKEFLKNLECRKVEVISKRKKTFSQKEYKEKTIQKILNLISRRPVSLKELKDTLGIGVKELSRDLEILLKKGVIVERNYRGSKHYKFKL